MDIETLEARFNVVVRKVDEMLDILKFWKTLMRMLKGIGTGALFLFALIHYGHQVTAWLSHVLGTSKK